LSLRSLQLPHHLTPGHKSGSAQCTISGYSRDTCIFRTQEQKVLNTQKVTATYRGEAASLWPKTSLGKNIYRPRKSATFLLKISLTRRYRFRSISLCPTFARISAGPVILEFYQFKLPLVAINHWYD